MILSFLLACVTGTVTLDERIASPCADGFYLEEDGNCYPNVLTDTDTGSTDTDSGTDSGETDSGETGEGEETDSGETDSGETGEETDSDSGTGDSGDTGIEDTDEVEEVDPLGYTATDVEFVYVGAIHYCAMDSWGYVACFTDPREIGYEAYQVPTDLTTVKFTDVSVNQYYSCGIREDDQTVECWGDEASYGTEPESTTFEAIASIASDEATSYTWTCGATTTGTVECWGLDLSGADSTPAGIADAALTNVSDLCVGGYGGNSFLCTQDTTDGAVSCLDLGPGDLFETATSSGPIVAGSLTCGKEQACGILDDGLGTIDCWGMEWEDADGVMDDSFGTVVGPFTGDDDAVYYETTATSLFDTVAAGPHWNCATAADGTFGCFGNSTSASFGLNDEILSEDNIDDNASLEDAIFTNLSLNEGGGCGVDIQSSGTSVVNCWGEYFDW